MGVLSRFALILCAAHTFGWDERRDSFLQVGSGVDVVVRVPFVVNVGLLGLAGDGHLDAVVDPMELEEVLSIMFSHHSPWCVETQESLNVRYNIEYKVMDLQTANLHHLEQLMKDSLHKATSLSLVPGAVQHDHVYDISADKFEIFFRDLHASSFPDRNDWRESEGMQRRDGLDTPSYTVFVINPDKSRVAPASAQGSPFTYRWVYEKGVPSQSFISSDGYVVLDLSAGPVAFGATTATEGAVSEWSFPNLEHFITSDKQNDDNENEMENDMENENENEMENMVDRMLDNSGERGAPRVKPDHSLPTEKHGSRRIELRSNIASLVVDCARHIFVGDVLFDTVDTSEQIMVPIIVLRNHHMFNPLTPGHPFSIDIETIQKQFTRLVSATTSQQQNQKQQEQQAKVVPVLHDLHDHPRISMAVRKAVRTDTVHEVRDGRYVPVTRTFLDAAVLESELITAADVLTTSMLSLSAPHSSHSDFQKGQSFDEQIQSQAVHGSRVVPVYVFSLIGIEEDLLLDNLSLMKATRQSVLVLQTRNPRIRTPFFKEKGAQLGTGEIVFEDGREVTRNILSGLLQTFGLVVPPYIRFSHHHNTTITDYRWSVGCHPFGPFSGTTSLSSIFVHTATRNAIISRIHATITTLRDVVALVENFAEDFMLEPEDIDRTHSQTWLIDRLFHSNENKNNAPTQAVLSSRVVAGLHNEMEALEDKIKELAVSVSAMNQAVAFQESSSVLLRASQFHSYVKEQLLQAETQLLCCEIVHTTATFTLGSRALLLFAVAVVVFFLALNINPPTIHKPKKR